MAPPENNISFEPATDGMHRVLCDDVPASELQTVSYDELIELDRQVGKEHGTPPTHRRDGFRHMWGVTEDGTLRNVPKSQNAS